MVRGLGGTSETDVVGDIAVSSESEGNGTELDTPLHVSGLILSITI